MTYRVTTGQKKNWLLTNHCRASWEHLQANWTFRICSNHQFCPNRRPSIYFLFNSRGKKCNQRIKTKESPWLRFDHCRNSSWVISKCFGLTAVMNACLKLKYVPSLWKVAEVIMINKPGKPPNEVTSYRPISLLPVMSKLLEKLFLKQLIPVINSKN